MEKMHRSASVDGVCPHCKLPFTAQWAIPETYPANLPLSTVKHFHYITERGLPVLGQCDAELFEINRLNEIVIASGGQPVSRDCGSAYPDKENNRHSIFIFEFANRFCRHVTHSTRGRPVSMRLGSMLSASRTASSPSEASITRRSEFKRYAKQKMGKITGSEETPRASVKVRMNYDPGRVAFTILRITRTPA